MLPQFGITCSRELKLAESKLSKEELLGSPTVTVTKSICLTLTHYIDVLAFHGLADRCEQLCRKFLQSVLQPSSCLHTLLPTHRDPTVTTRLRSANKFPRLPSHTRKY